MTPGETAIFGRALGEIGRAQDALGETQRGRLRRVPPSRGVEAFDACPPWHTFEFPLAPELHAIDSEVRMLGGDAWSSLYWQLVELCLIARMLQGPRQLVLPPAVETLLVAELDRVVDAAESDERVANPLANESFVLDVAMSRGLAIPLDTYFGAPVWMPDGLEGFGAGLWLQMHFRAVASRGFGRETVIAVTPLNFDLFLANPHLKGWFGVTWLLDPQLAEVSPHLAWYRELFLQAGAHIAPVATQELTIAYATDSSQTRREMFEQGQYQPTDHIIVMPREQGLKWYETTAGLLPTSAGES